MKIILMRHGDALLTENQAGVSRDKERPLSDTGRTQSEQVALELKKLQIEWDLALVSSALRTRQTFERVNQVFQGAEAQFKEELYLAGPTKLFQILATLTTLPVPQNIFLIGHNPGLSEFAGQLLGESIHFVPSSVLVIELSHLQCAWGDLGMHRREGQWVTQIDPL